nr:MAG TPA: hypothetical protein [Caudoviricetes sp.]
MIHGQRKTATGLWGAESDARCAENTPGSL